MKKLITYIGIAGIALYLYVSVIKTSVDAINESIAFMRKQHKQAENLIAKEASAIKFDDDSEDKKGQDISHLVKF